MSRQIIGLTKRGQTWQYSFTAPNGQRVRRSAQTADKDQAKELATAHYNELWRQQKLGERPRYSWQEAVMQWLEEKPERKESKDSISLLRWLDTHLGSKRLDEIDRDAVLEVRRAKQAEGVKPRTVNAVLQQMRVVLRAAVEWEWIDKTPSIKLLATPKRRIRWLSSDDEERLLSELPPHLQDIAQFALATGLRMSNITGLEWSQVDMVGKRAWIHADQAKAGQAIGVPLNSDAMRLILRQLGRHQTHVFTFQGHPVLRANQAAWRKAVKRAGLEDFHFHDLRHTWATRHIMSGTPLYVLQELGGWTDSEMVRRYAHLSIEHLHLHAENTTGTNLAQMAHK